MNFNSVWCPISGKMIPQRAQVVLSLDAEEVGSLQEGVNFKKNPQDGKCYIIYKNGDLRACRNQCKHQGGLFIKDIEDLDGRWDQSDSNTFQAVFVIFITADKFFSSHRIVKCTKHNWKLNVSTMKYVNPPDSFMQEELGKFFQHLYFGLVIIGLCLECGCWPVTFFCAYMATTWGIF